VTIQVYLLYIILHYLLRVLQNSKDRDLIIKHNFCKKNTSKVILSDQILKGFTVYKDHLHQGQP